MNQSSLSIHIIGLNPTSFRDLPESIRDLIYLTKKIAGSTRIITDFRYWWKATHKSKEMPQICETDNIKDLVKWIKEQNETVIIFASGDPLWFGIGRYLV